MRDGRWQSGEPVVRQIDGSQVAGVRDDAIGDLRRGAASTDDRVRRRISSSTHAGVQLVAHGRSCPQEPAATRARYSDNGQRRRRRGRRAAASNSAVAQGNERKWRRRLDEYRRRGPTDAADNSQSSSGSFNDGDDGGGRGTLLRPASVMVRTPVLSARDRRTDRSLPMLQPTPVRTGNGRWRRVERRNGALRRPTVESSNTGDGANGAATTTMMMSGIDAVVMMMLPLPLPLLALSGKAENAHQSSAVHAQSRLCRLPSLLGHGSVE